MSQNVWQRPSRAIRRWALAAVILMIGMIVLAGAALGWSTIASNAYAAAVESEQVAYDASVEADGTANEEQAQTNLADAAADLAKAEADLKASTTGFGVLLTSALVAGALALIAAIVAVVKRVRTPKARGSVSL